MKKSHIIIGVHIQDRVKQVPDLQKIFTDYGCQIKTRLGLHDVDNQICSPTGIIILDLIGDDSQIEALMQELNSQNGIEVKKMVFEHE